MPWSRAVRSGPFVHVAAIAPVGADGRVVASDIQGQTRAVLAEMARTLEAAGASLARAASIHVYLRRASDFPAMNEVYATHWTADPPVRTTVVAEPANPDVLVEMSAIAVAPGAPREVIHPGGWIKSPNPYSYGIKSGDTLFMAGLVSRSGRDNSDVPGDMSTQTTTVLRNGEEILKAAGMSMADVVSARVFITEGAGFQAMNESYRRFFPKDPPARATVICPLMRPSFLVEITLVAVAGAREVVAVPNADGTPRPANPNLSPAIRVGDRVFVSGMLGNDTTNKGDMRAQSRATLAALGRALTAAGADWARVTDAIVYVTDTGRVAEVDAAWREVFGSSPPTRTLVRTGLVAPDGLVEIMLNAVR
jgi:enamine deaminase RidA (YjgF/YER057c/UK114 family)